MNSTVYLFGNLGNGYTQYPMDYTQDIFKHFRESSFSLAQIIIHRDNSLMYYAYIRNLEKEKYIGFCFLLNGVMLTNIDELFDLFENMITFLSIRGEILKINDNGDIVSNTQILFYQSQIIQQIISSLENALNEFELNRKKLPVIAYAVSKEEKKQFDISVDEIQTIIEATYTYGYTFVLKNADSKSLNSYQGIVKRLNKEKEELLSDKEKLLANIVKLEKQKKQKNKVMFLGIAVSICVILMMSFQQTLSDTKLVLADTQTSLTQLENDYKDTQTSLTQLENDYKNDQSSFLTKMADKDRNLISLQNENKQLFDFLSEKKQQMDKIVEENENLQIQLNDAISEKEYYKNLITDVVSERDSYKKQLDKVAVENRSYNKPSANAKESYGNTYSSTKEKTIVGIISFNTSLRAKWDPLSDEILVLKKGLKVDVYYLEHVDGYYKVKYRNHVGYVHQIALDFKYTEY